MRSGDHGCTNCDEAMNRLHQYVDRELSAAELEEVRVHLESCPPCGRHFDFEEQLKLLVHRKACTERAPHDLLSRILGNLKTT